MVLHNPNNWHWVNKDASGWTKEWLEESIKGMKAEEDGVTAQLDKVISMDGDVDVSQRKGKVITIFDVKVVIEYSGKLVHTEVSSNAYQTRQNQGRRRSQRYNHRPRISTRHRRK